MLEYFYDKYKADGTYFRCRKHYKQFRTGRTVTLILVAIAAALDIAAYFYYADTLDVRLITLICIALAVPILIAAIACLNHALAGGYEELVKHPPSKIVFQEDHFELQYAKRLRKHPHTVLRMYYRDITSLKNEQKRYGRILVFGEYQEIDVRSGEVSGDFGEPLGVYACFKDFDGVWMVLKGVSGRLKGDALGGSGA